MYNEGGKDLSKSANLLHTTEVVRDMFMEEVFLLVKEGEGKGKGATSGGSGQICGRLNFIGSAKEASTSTHALIMEARGMSSVRACVVSVPGEEEGKSHRKISSPLDMTEASWS